MLKETLKLVKPSFLLVRDYKKNIVDNWLLHPQHLGRIGIGQDQYRLSGTKNAGGSNFPLELAPSDLYLLTKTGSRRL